MSDLLVKAIRVRVRNSPKVSLCATPDRFANLLPLALPFLVVPGHHASMLMLLSFGIAYLGLSDAALSQQKKTGTTANPLWKRNIGEV
jgi:hypothetical protein